MKKAGNGSAIPGRFRGDTMRIATTLGLTRPQAAFAGKDDRSGQPQLAADVPRGQTETPELEEQRFAMWKRGTSSVTTRLYNTSGDTNLPVSVGGTVVLPASAVRADPSGVLSVARTDHAAVLGRDAMATNMAVCTKRGPRRASILVPYWGHRDD